MKLSFVLSTALALAMGASSAFAGDSDKPEGRPAKATNGRILVFGDGAARFQVERDSSAGRMTFRLADSNVKIDRAPVVLVSTSSGPREISLVAAEGQPGVWVWSDDLVKADSFDGTMRVVVAGRTYTSPLTTVWTTEAPGVPVEPTSFTETVKVNARYGGHILTFPDCNSSVEVVQDPATGMLTVYPTESFAIAEAPVITITQSKSPTSLTLTKVDGKPGVWMVKNDMFKSRTITSARIRVLIEGKPCETALVYGSGHGGQLVTVSGGPSFEVVSDAKTGSYTFYAIDETYDGKAYTIENPTVVVSGRTYTLTRVENEPRAWRLVGLDAAGTDSRNAQLNFTLFGKTLSTRIGLSGLGVGVK